MYLQQHQATIATHLAVGIPQSDIARSLGVNKSSVCRSAHDPSTIALVESIQDEIVNTSLAEAKDALVGLVHTYKVSMSTPNDVPVSNRESVKIDQGGRIVRGLMQSIGILPTHSPSLSISIMSQTQINLSPAVTEALSAIVAPHSPGQEPDPED